MHILRDSNGDAVALVDDAGIPIDRIAIETAAIIRGDSRTSIEDDIRNGIIAAVKHGRATRIKVPSFLADLNNRPRVRYAPRVRGTQANITPQN